MGCLIYAASFGFPAQIGTGQRECRSAEFGERRGMGWSGTRKPVIQKRFEYSVNDPASARA